MEYLNLYDRKGKLLKEKGIRGEKTEYLVGIVIIFIQNSKGEFLIQKTSKSRHNTFATTGGHVSFGATFKDTIINEIKEELGIEVLNDEIIEMNTYIEEKYIQKVYYLNKDIDIKEVTVQQEEIEYVKWLDINSIEELIKADKFRQSNIKGYRYVLSKI